MLIFITWYSETSMYRGPRVWSLAQFLDLGVEFLTPAPSLCRNLGPGVRVSALGSGSWVDDLISGLRCIDVLLYGAS